MSGCGSGPVSRLISRFRSRNGERFCEMVVPAHRAASLRGKGGSMRSLAKLLTPGAMIAGALIGAAATAPAMDGSQVINDRAALMKQQAKDLNVVKAYFAGNGDQAAAAAAAADLTRTTRKIPDLFPPGSDAASPGGKFAPKPEIWSQWDKFLAAQRNA